MRLSRRIMAIRDYERKLFRTPITLPTSVSENAPRIFYLPWEKDEKRLVPDITNVKYNGVKNAISR